jgi:hypothetical protein
MKKKCRIANCKRPVYAKGMCRPCYDRRRYLGNCRICGLEVHRDGLCIHHFFEGEDKKINTCIKCGERHMAKSFCQKCYYIYWVKENKKK